MNNQPGKLIVLTGPSGVGKGTLVYRLLERHPQLFLSVSMTTRSPRPREIEGKHYYFVSPREFEQKVEASELLEWAEYAGNYYGTPRRVVEELLRQGNSVLLEIELEGARQIAASFPEALRIFILPPSMSELERRLRRRSSEDDGAIARRLERAIVEIAAADEFNLQIINDDLETTIAEIEAVLHQNCVGRASRLSET